MTPGACCAGMFHGFTSVCEACEPEKLGCSLDMFPQAVYAPMHDCCAETNLYEGFFEGGCVLDEDADTLPRMFGVMATAIGALFSLILVLLYYGVVVMFWGALLFIAAALATAYLACLVLSLCQDDDE